MNNKVIATALALSTLTIGTFTFVNSSNAQTPTAKTALSKTFCPSGEESIATKIKLFAETKTFYINICKATDSSGAYYYDSRLKNGEGKDTIVRLSTVKKGLYTAETNRYQIILDLNKKSLKVYQGGANLVLQEQVYNVRYF